MIKGTLADGYEYEIDDEALNDWEIVEAIEEAEEQPQKVVTIAKRLLGDDGYKKLKEACRVNGRIAFDYMASKVFEIMTDSGKAKN